MKKYIVSAFLTLSLSNAFAADVEVPDDVPVIKASEAAMLEPVAERWGGFYMGAAAGMGYATDSAPAKASAGAYGGFVGYNHQMGNFVVGVEATADSFDATFDDGSGIKSRFLYAGRVRAGWANDLFFAYGALGAEHGVTNLPVPFSKDTTLQLGAGVDFAVTDKISLGADFTYAKYKEFADFTFFGKTIDVGTKKVQARLSYTFN